MKRLFSTLLVLCMVFSLCACGTPAPGETPKTPDESTPAAVKDTLIYSVGADNSTFDPKDSMSIGCKINGQVFECLIREEADGTLSPGLAESWEISDDNLTVTFKLREGVKFHNGDIMTADDVVFSLERTMASGSQDFAKYISAVEKTDDTHVKISMSTVFSDIIPSLSVINTAIVCKRAVEESGDAFGTSPVGTGPYMLDTWTVGTSMVLKAFPEYWRGEAAIKTVTFLIQPNASTASIALENNEVDALNACNLPDLPHLKELENVTVYEVAPVSLFALYLNCTSGPLADVRVRKAISLCLNRDDFIMGILDGNGTPAYTLISSSMAYYNADIVGADRNIEEAKALLAEAGYENGLTIKYATVAEAPDLVNLGSILQGNLAEAGITVEIDVKEYSAWFTEVQANHEFDLTCAATTANATLPDAIMSNILATGAVNNLGLYSNAKVEEYLATARSTYDEAVKQQCYDEVSKIVIDECPVIPLMGTNVNMAASSQLGGVVLPAVSALHIYDWYWLS